MGDGAFPARMVINVAGIGATNEDVGVGVRPAAPKPETRRTSKALDDRMRALP